MYKITLTFIAAVILLSSCSNQENSRNNKEENDNNLQSVQNIDEQKSDPIETENTNYDNITSLPEYNKIIQVIDKEDYTFKIVTDNENKRILLIQGQDGIPQYKTIFIKNKGLLKVINTNGDNQIFSDFINYN